MTANLTPYVPRLLIEWERDAPDASHRLIDGTLVFIDISGFTAMSERLARSGKVGAEEVTEVMNASFTRLLEHAYREGGSLLKFGGDALLLFYSGQGHSARACRAALAMRRALREFGRFRTSAGIVSLRMSIGVHSGECAFFLAGDAPRELIVTGPAVSKTVEMESAAQAGEILISVGTAAALPTGAREADHRGGFLLKRLAPRNDDAAREDTALVFERSEAFVPIAIREHLSASPAEGEHRHVTVAFLHFDGTDATLATDGPIELARQLDEMMHNVQATALEHDVCVLATDIDRDGGKVILTAGAPRSNENDEERMLRAVRQIQDNGNGLVLRIGVNRGPVFAGDIGPAYRKTYTVMGDAVNLAARLMAKAAPGQILATEGVIERSRTQFHTEALAPFTVKGKAAPITAYAVGPVRALRARGDASRVPLIGREQEVGFLASRLDSVEAGGAAVVELIGPAGIGKSRLLREVAALRPDLAFFETVAEQYASSTPYFVFGALLRAVLGLSSQQRGADGDALRMRVHDAAPELAPWLPLIALVMAIDVPSTPEVDRLEPRFRRSRLHDTVTAFLTRLLPTPALIVFDDADWLDEASRELLRFIAASVSDSPWLVCVSSGPDASVSYADVAPNGATLRLEPLSPEAALALTSAAAGDTAITQHELHALAERAGGNPLFLREIVANRLAQREAVSMPESVEALLTARIDRLPSGDRRLLRFASVFGASVDIEALTDSFAGLISPVDDAAWSRLDEFLVSDAPGTVRFKHGLVREVAYEGLPFRLRRDLHGRVGSFMEARLGVDVEAEADLLSLHFERAQDHQRAYRYSRIAGERSKARFANVEAAEAFGRAIYAARYIDGIDDDELAALNEARGDLFEVSGMYAEAAAAYRAARRCHGYRGAHPGGLSLKEGVVRERLGRYSQALRWYGRALRDGKTAAPDRVKLGLAYAGVRFRQGRYADCARRAKEALADAESVRDRAGQAHAYYLLDHANTMLGNAASGRFRALALPIFEELGDLIGQANVLNNLGVAATLEGRWDEAIASFERSRAAREKAGDVVGAATASNNIGEVLLNRGRIDEAESLFNEALRVWRGARYPVGIAVATSALGLAAARAGRQAEARALLREALDGFRELRAETFVVETEARLAELEVSAGEDDEAARALIEAAIQHAERVGGEVVSRAALHRLLGDVRLRNGNAAGARASYDESLRLSRSIGAEFESACTLQSCARLMHELSLPADQELQESLAIQRRLGIIELPYAAGASALSTE
jgi:class 3 adenylate cyclase/tetratricopeptide (TPR) repeat protein